MKQLNFPFKDRNKDHGRQKQRTRATNAVPTTLDIDLFRLVYTVETAVVSFRVSVKQMQF